jgi:hypothetical protein
MWMPYLFYRKETQKIIAVPIIPLSTMAGWPVLFIPPRTGCNAAVTPVVVSFLAC